MTAGFLNKLIFSTGIILFTITIVHGQTYKIVDTDQIKFYDAARMISAPLPGQAFYGQDATYVGNQPSYKDKKDGTITDNVTGLMWQKEMGIKISCADAIRKADTLRLGGYSDWRVPTVKELYSLILFSGQVSGEKAIKNFINDSFFYQPLGNTEIGEREIDAQTWSSTQYISLTFNRDSTVFGVNFIDGRIKGYPKYQPGSNNSIPSKMYFRMVRGNHSYGVNNFVDNNDGTITDKATGLMWQKSDDGLARDWENALSYSENLTFANYSDWRLPNAKELQSIVDYSRCPKITNSPAINPIFNTTSIKDPDGNSGQYPYFWTSTSHLDGVNPYSAAAYVAFGEAQGKVNGVLMDVHGAGAQRSDPKTGNPADYPQFMGPQGDVRIVFNYVRCVRNVSNSTGINEQLSLPILFKLEQNYPNPFNPETIIKYTIGYNSFVQLKVYDILGREIATLVNQFQRPGNYSVSLNSRNLFLTSGIYYYTLSAGSYSQSRKMICLR